jgi:hypothetical protein
MDCPICTRVVLNLTPPTYDGLVVGCPRCGQYRIMQSALPELMTLQIEGRLVALRKAKSSASQSWPTITRTSLP